MPDERTAHYLDGDTVLASRDGERRDVRNSAAPVRTPQGDLIGAVLVFQDVTHSRALQRELAHTAMHDSLTGLPNRATFEQALGRPSARRSARCASMRCALSTSTASRSVNDTAGHGAGDVLLQDIARPIRGACRAHDLAARIGGDEFALLLPDCSVAAQARCREGHRRHRRHPLRMATLQARPTRFGASVGITAITAQANGPAELMSQADAACYAAKARGRNCVAIYDDDAPGSTQLRTAPDLFRFRPPPVPPQPARSPGPEPPAGGRRSPPGAGR